MINTISKNRISLIQPPSLAEANSKEKGKTANVITKNENKRLREPADVNFCGFFSSEKMVKVYKSKGFHKVLEFAKDQQLVFGAAFALLLTCVLRPAAIVITPSKKNKDDQKYASAHSIASGVIGFAISTILFLPIGNAIKRFGKVHANFLKDYGDQLKQNSYLKNEKNYQIAKTFIDRAPDIIAAVPKGILTVALIPAILKHVFGLEKKKANSDKNVTAQPVDFSLLNFKSADKPLVQKVIGGAK